jgi:uncharacterized protein YqeY
MNLEEKVNELLKEAIKGGNHIRMNTLRSIRASIIEFNKSGIGRAMTPDDELKILQSAIKKRKEAIELYEKGGRQELADREKEEIKIIQEFLPEQLNEDEIRDAVKKIITEVNASSLKDLGKVMGRAMQELKGKAEGSLVQSIAKELLSE